MHTAPKDALREYHAHRCPGQQKHKAASGEIRPVKRTIAPQNAACASRLSTERMLQKCLLHSRSGSISPDIGIHFVRIKNCMFHFTASFSNSAFLSVKQLFGIFPIYAGSELCATAISIPSICSAIPFCFDASVSNR